MAKDGFYFLYSEIERPEGAKRRFSDIFEVKDDSIYFYDLEVAYNGQRVIDSYLTPSGQVAPDFGVPPIPYQPDWNLLDTILSSHPSYRGEDIDELKKIYKISNAPLNAGEYYPMISRPIIHKEIFNQNGFHIYNDAYNNSDSNPLNSLNFGTYRDKLPQFELLIDELTSVFKVVEPIKDNKDVFGHQIRNIIILACTEVENLFKSILKEHTFTKKGMLTIKDYWKINQVLKLSTAYCYFPRYTHCGFIHPFKEWNAEEFVKLSWYDAYNAAKHDREGSIKLATLENAVLSVAAVGIMLVTMYGDSNDYWKDKAGKFMVMVNELADFTEFWDYPKFCVNGKSSRGLV